MRRNLVMDQLTSSEPSPAATKPALQRAGDLALAFLTTSGRPAPGQNGAKTLDVMIPGPEFSWKTFCRIRVGPERFLTQAVMPQEPEKKRSDWEAASTLGLRKGRQAAVNRDPGRALWGNELANPNYWQGRKAGPRGPQWEGD